jgi:PAS domain S-box-containing protein
MTAEPADPELALRNVALRNLAAIEGARDRADLELRSRTHELAATVALLQATFDAANDAMLATDLRGRATVANQALLELWGLDRGPLFAESADTLAALQARLEWPADFARVGTAGTPRQELRLQSGRTVECSVRPQLIAGAPVGHVWVFRDVTQERLTFAALQHERASAERLNAELERRVQERTEALERLNNNLDAFSYSVSHSGCAQAPERSDFAAARPASGSLGGHRRLRDGAGARPGARARPARRPRTAPAIPRANAGPGAPPGRTAPASPRPRRQPLAQAAEEAAQHAAVGVVDGLLQRRAGLAGSHGGLHTMSGAARAGTGRLRGGRPVLQPRRSMLSRAQASARGFRSVATTRATPRRASTAAITPVPVPMSQASEAPGGKGAAAIRSRYSPRTGENTP